MLAFSETDAATREVRDELTRAVRISSCRGTMSGDPGSIHNNDTDIHQLSYTVATPFRRGVAPCRYSPTPQFGVVLRPDRRQDDDRRGQHRGGRRASDQSAFTSARPTADESWGDSKRSAHWRGARVRALTARGAAAAVRHRPAGVEALRAAVSWRGGFRSNPDDDADLDPQVPPRVRLEWLIASSRIVLAGGALLAVAVSPSDPLNNWSLAYALGWYLVYSLLVLGLVWTPVRFARGWGVAQHAFDLAAFSLFNFYTDAATSPLLRVLHVPRHLRHAALGRAGHGVDGHRHLDPLRGHEPVCRIELAPASVPAERVPHPSRPSGGDCPPRRLSWRAPSPLPERAGAPRHLAETGAAQASRAGRGAGERVLGRPRSIARADCVGGAGGRFDQPRVGRRRRRDAGEGARGDVRRVRRVRARARDVPDDARERRRRRRDPLVGRGVPQAERAANPPGIARTVRHGPCRVGGASTGN